MNKLGIILFVIAVILVSKLDKQPDKSVLDEELNQKAQLAIQNIDSKLSTNKYQNGHVKALSDNYILKEEFVNKRVKQSTNNMPQKASYILQWKDSLNNIISLTALGMDWKHHFANSFLVGIRPFEVENKWLPLYTISKLKTYELDKAQHNVPEMWQNSAQAFMLPRGDCEDHAIILADWLISEGVDARVVGGKYKTGGHAWVVAIIDNQEFILEATDKRVGKSWNHYPLASLAKHYYPSFMFNRTQFWINENRAIKDNYQGNHWRQTSTFVKN